MIFLLEQIFTFRPISVWYSKPYAFKILNDMIHCIKETFGYLECEGASGLFKKFLTIQLTKQQSVSLRMYYFVCIFSFQRQIDQCNKEINERYKNR